MQPPDYHFPLNTVPPIAMLLPLAGMVHQRVFRADFSDPGFALLTLPPQTRMRAFLRAMAEALCACEHYKTGQELELRSALRFDQQNTTRFHLDGGPAESYLVLGYEPTTVPSTIAMADYAHAALHQGLTPSEYLTHFNPLRPEGEEKLQPYVTPLTAFDPVRANVIIVNNSCLPYAPERGNRLGVLHQATIPQPDPRARRIIHSILLAPIGE